MTSDKKKTSGWQAKIPVTCLLSLVTLLSLVATQLLGADSPPVLSSLRSAATEDGRSSATVEGGREHLSLDANWKFHLGDDWPDALSLVNSGTGGGPASEKFSDTYWRVVNLPHEIRRRHRDDSQLQRGPRFAAQVAESNLR